MTVPTSLPARPGGRLLRRALSAAGRQPVSIGIAALLVVLAVASGSALSGPPDSLRDLVGAGLAERATGGAWLATLASILFAGDLPELLASVVAVLVLVGAAERRIGHRRALLAYVVTGVVATLSGLLVQAVGTGIGEYWAREVAGDTTLHPFTPALGTIMTASAFAGPLWRRRIRLVGFAAITAFLLYDGHPSGLYALLGALAGLGLGRLLRPGGRTVGRPWTRSSHHEARVLLSALVALTALGPLITLLTRSPIGVLAPLGALFGGSPDSVAQRVCAAHVACGPPSVAHGPAVLALSLLPLAALLVAAALIRRGQRLAVWFAIVANVAVSVLTAFAFSIVPILRHGTWSLPRHDVERFLVGVVSAVVPLAVAAVLVGFLHHFTVRTAPAVARRYVAVVALAFVALVGAGVAIALVRRVDFAPRTTVAEVAVSLAERFVPVGFLGVRNSAPAPDGAAVRAAFDLLGPVFWLVVIVGLIVSCASPRQPGSTPSARAAVDRILLRGVPGHLGHLATWAGTSYWIAPDGEAAVAYRRVGGSAITVGDPLCSDDRAEEVVLGFARWCDERGVVPVFYSVRAALTPVFRSLGWSTLEVAEESVIRLDSFSLQGRKRQDLRSSLNRAAREGIRAEWTTYAALRPSVARQIDDISEAWVAGRELPEMGFTLGGLDELADPRVALLVAIDGNKGVHAATSWLPTYRDGVVVGWTLDFMRRSPDAMPGVMEFAIASAALRAKDDGLEFVSLSAAPLAVSAGDDSDGGQTARVLALVGRVLEPAYGFRSLLAFKAKFQPDFEPLLLAYPDPLQLPAIGTALARAYMPDLGVRQLPRLLRAMR